MSFDKPTRNLLAKTVAACRERLAADITDQLQSSFGLYPDGTQLDVARTEAERRAAEDLRALLAHYEANLPEGKDRPKVAYQRLVRDAGFTLLNRLAALRLCEERGLVIECVRQGMESDGFRLFDMLANGALGNRYQTYRVFLERMFDELARDLGALFDRGNPLSQVFPSEAALGEVLGLLNQADLARLWTQDETIGWIYQYYNDPAERKKMREESQAPRNSRELAVRNQFFTPRYVVEFLTDNTLGRLWLEMRGGESRLTEECRYLVHRNSIFENGNSEDASQISSSEYRVSNIQSRSSKDPRDLKILDPACGSGHFLLYAFDLLLVMYEEAWGDADLPPFSETGTWLARDYPSLEELRRALPELILRHNLYGVDIDPRAAQIAALALWLRAQRAWMLLDVSRTERPQVRKTNVVVAEPMPGDARLLEEFLAGLEALPFIKQLVRVIFEKMKLAGEAGSLLKIEADLREAIAAAKEQWLKRPQAEQMSLWAEPARPQARQLGMFDLSGIADEQFWKEAEGRALEALREYARQAEDGKGTRRKLFAGEAEMGFAFVDLCRQEFDVVLMNPPFGSEPSSASEIIQRFWKLGEHDLATAFVSMAFERISKNGLIGILMTRTPYFLSRFSAWRNEYIVGQDKSISLFADFGMGVLDSALVEAVAAILSKGLNEPVAFDFRSHSGNQIHASEFDVSRCYRFNISHLKQVPNSPLAYWVPKSILGKFSSLPLYSVYGEVKQGLATKDNERFVRTWWEVPIENITSQWKTYAKGGEYSKYYLPLQLVVDWSETAFNVYKLREGQMVVLLTGKREKYTSRSGMTYSKRSQVGFSARAMPYGTIFSPNGPGVFPKNEEFLYFDLAFLNSKFARACLEFLTSFGSYSEGYVESLPYPNHLGQSVSKITNETRKCVESKRDTFAYDETCREFTNGLGSIHNSLSSWCNFVNKAQFNSQNQFETFAGNLDNWISDDLSLSKDELAFADKYSYSVEPATQDADESPISFSVVEIISLLLGAVFGRWDIRIIADRNLIAKLPQPFDLLPVSPPITLSRLDGFSATSGNIVSEAWLRARPDAISLPEMRERGGQTFVVLDGKEYPATISDSDYPLPIPWDGILVDDPGLDGKSPHPADLVERVRQVLRLLWPENHSAIEAEACEILGVKDLREYFRKPGGFFADHLKRYSKSRRQAPIYWPLSTASGSYTLWLYYPRLSNETLPTALNRFVDPKIAEVEKTIAALELQLSQISGRAATDLRDQLDEQKSLLTELRDFRAELLRISALPYQPDLNDGVILNAAPLHRLFRLGKWSKDTESAWKKLQAEEYEWSHIAYVTWPERVREACKTDKSIAIAHGLEGLYVEVEGKKVKGKRKRQPKEDELEIE